MADVTSHSVNVLLVDDSPANLLTLEAVLAPLGVVLHRSSSGEHACRRVTEADYAVVLLDVRMPTMDGFETAARIRATPRSKSTPIIFLTAQPGDEDVLDQVYSFSAVDFLAKPLNPRVLLSKVGFFVELHRNKEELRTDRAFLAAVLEAVEDGIVACGPDGTLTLFNRATREMHGLPVQPLPLERWSEHYNLYRPDGETLMSPDEIPLAKALAGEYVRNAELVIAPAGRKPIKLAASGRPLIDESGRKLGAVVSMHDITARHEAEAARRAADALSLFNKRLAEVFRQAPAFMCVVREPLHVFEMVNDRYLQLIGNRKVIGKPVAEALPEVVEQGFVAMLDRVYATGEPYVGTDVRIVLQQTPGGPPDERFIDFVYLPLRGPDGAISGILAHGVDLTDRKRAEQALRASEMRVRLATDAAGLGVWVWEPAIDAVTWENDRSQQIFGLTAKEPSLTAARFRAEFLVAEDGDEFARAAANSLRTGKPFLFEGRFFRPHSAEVRWIALTGLLEPRTDGSPVRMIGTAADITDRKRAEAELKASESRYRALFNSMDEGFCVIELVFDAIGAPVDWRYLETNPAFVQQTGLADAIGRTAREVMPNIEENWIHGYGQVALTGKPMRMVAASRDLGGWFDVSATRIGEAAERKVAVFFSDITLRRRAEDELRKLAADLADADKQKNEFLATLAHELRNPMTPLRTGLRLLNHPKQEAEILAPTIAMMERQLGHMVHLVDDLLDVARISGGKLELRKERTDLASVIGSAVESSTPVIEARGHELTVDVAEPAVELAADPTRVSQVLSNLLDNAAKYTPAGGRIRLAAHRAGAEVVISVTDNGVGIAAESMPRIFEMFTRVGKNAHGGLGIGLSIVRRLIEMHGGTIEAESGGLGSGTTFTVRLPLGVPADNAGDLEHRETSPTGAAEPLHLLVVDDNVDAARSLSTLLELSGHSVSVAADGLEALRSAVETAPQVVFLDIGMPGMSGYEVAQALRRMPSGERLVIAAVTGWGSSEDKARAKDAGFDHHLTKPIDLDRVEQILRSVSGGLRP